MTYITKYKSPIGILTLATDGEAIIGLWIQGQKYFGRGVFPPFSVLNDHPVLHDAAEFLDAYFSADVQSHSLLLRPYGTPFQQQVWSYLLQIPYGQTVTYGDISKSISNATGKTMSAQAVGSAVGRNPISILIPCHRVVGAGGKLTGYAGGIQAKERLLQLEKENSNVFP